jgi:hypothetical protein
LRELSVLSDLPGVEVRLIFSIIAVHIVGPLNLPDFSEQERVTENAEDENDSGNDEVQTEAASSLA